MKKFIKFILVLGLLLLPCFSIAVQSYTTISAGNVHLNANATDNFLNDNSMYFKDTFCMMNDGGTLCNFTATFNGVSANINQYRMVGCLIGISVDANHPVVVHNNLNSECTAKFMAVNSKDWRPDYTSLQCQTEYNLIPVSSVDQNYCTSNGLCPSQYTSLECQTEYNLIPVSEVTANYCKLNFDLISPSECPSGGGCSGSGDSIVFSNVYVNNVLYPGGADIYLNVNELLATEISYNSQLMYIDVDYDGDQDYINGIIDINTYQPTSNDFTQIFVGGLVRLFPYIVIALFIIFVRKLIRKIFK